MPSLLIHLPSSFPSSSLRLSCPLTLSIFTLKTLLVSRVPGHPVPNKQQLVYQGHVLDNERTLEQIGELGKKKKEEQIRGQLDLEKMVEEEEMVMELVVMEEEMENHDRGEKKRKQGKEEEKNVKDNEKEEKKEVWIGEKKDVDTMDWMQKLKDHYAGVEVGISELQRKACIANIPETVPFPRMQSFQSVAQANELQQNQEQNRLNAHVPPDQGVQQPHRPPARIWFQPFLIAKMLLVVSLLVVDAGPIRTTVVCFFAAAYYLYNVYYPAVAPEANVAQDVQQEDQDLMDHVNAREHQQPAPRRQMKQGLLKDMERFVIGFFASLNPEWHPSS